MIAVIGLGFVGLTTALGFAHKGFKVYGFDTDAEKTRKLNNGIIPFCEPSLDKFLKLYRNKRFFIASSIREAVANSKIIFYCVGTPSQSNGQTNFFFLKSSLKNSIKFIKKNDYKILVIKSSIPPTAVKKVIKPLIEKYGFEVGKDIGLANNPEFLREGYAWEDFINPDRIVIGANEKKCSVRLERIYKSFGCPIFIVSWNTAEFIKYLSNSLLANLISFSNEMSMIADGLKDIDIAKSFKILHLDKRWSGMPAKITSYAYPGCGFGGYCLPKDVSALYNISKNAGYEPSLIREILRVNTKIKEHFVKKIIKSADKNKYIGILGLSFKPNSDDVRDTAARYIIEALVKKGYKRIIAFDPMSVDNFRRHYKLPILYAQNLEEVVEKCNPLVLITAWDEFKLKKKLFKNKTVIDGRYFL